jgi:hypothetical protein
VCDKYLNSRLCEIDATLLHPVSIHPGSATVFGTDVRALLVPDVNMLVSLGADL